MATRFASEKRAFAFCDRCGFRCNLRVMSYVYILGKRQNIKVCPECKDYRNGDNEAYWWGIIGGQKASNDPQALRTPRPDTNRNASCTDFAFNPVATLVLYTTVNNVNVTGFTSVAPTFRPIPPVMGPVDL